MSSVGAPAAAALVPTVTAMDTTTAERFGALMKATSAAVRRLDREAPYEVWARAVGELLCADAILAYVTVETAVAPEVGPLEPAG